MRVLAQGRIFRGCSRSWLERRPLVDEQGSQYIARLRDNGRGVGEIRGAHGRGRKYLAGFWWRHPKETDRLEDLGIDGRIMLKLILASSSRKCTFVSIIQLIWCMKLKRWHIHSQSSFVYVTNWPTVPFCHRIPPQISSCQSNKSGNELQLEISLYFSPSELRPEHMLTCDHSWRWTKG